MNGTDVAILAAVIGPALAFASAWLGFRATAASEARKQASQQFEVFYGRLSEDNQRLSAENEQHESRMQELTGEVAGLHRRLGTYEADLARLQRENDSLRHEIERQAGLMMIEANEKRRLSQHLLIEQREKTELLKRVVKLEATLASMAGVITTASEHEGGGA